MLNKLFVFVIQSLHTHVCDASHPFDLIIATVGFFILVCGNSMKFYNIRLVMQVFEVM